MHFQLILFCYLFCVGNGIGINSKLDFGDSKPIVKTRSNPTIFYEKKEIIRPKTEDNLENLGVVCTTEGCNTTKAETPNIKTDVLVEVKTTVDLSNKTQTKEDVPDVPIILGTNGDAKTLRQNEQYDIPQSKNTFGNPSIVNIEDAFPSVFAPKSSSRVDIINPLPSIEVKIPAYNGLKYHKEIKIPYFEPSYHNHYYGENPPPQVTFYKNVNTNNPVAFVNIPKIQPVSVWGKNYISTRVHGMDCFCRDNNLTPGLHWNSNFGSVNAARNSNRRISGTNNDPGSQINDKLAPLT